MLKEQGGSATLRFGDTEGHSIAAKTKYREVKVFYVTVLSNIVHVSGPYKVVFLSV